MSRKKNLSPTATVASCLDFAARVLSSMATVQEICTKAVLAPMVVEAHRFGQQVMKQLESGAPADVRELVRMLQSEQNNELCRDSPLMGLDVADLTWDFEGSVADTLDMELEELDDRAAMNAVDTCIVFSASSPVSCGGQAIIWLPQESNGGLRNAEDRKKRQILLYVCPGRVKVVKSVGDLIKKMYEELPTLREDGAIYNVWAVVMGSKSDNQQEDQSDAMQLGVTDDDASNQHPTGSALKPSNSPTKPMSTPSAFADTNLLQASTRSKESRRSRVSDSNYDAIDRQLGSLENQVEASSEPQDKDLARNELPSVSPRLSVYQNVSETKLYAPKSMFLLGLQQRTSLELLEVGEPAKKGDEEIIPDPVSAVGGETYATSAEDEVNLREDNQNQDSRPKRTIVSASLSNFTKGTRPEAETGLDLGVRLHQGFAWQSCDGKVLRRSVLPPRPIPYTRAEAKVNAGLANSALPQDRVKDKETFGTVQLSEVYAGHDEGHDDTNDGVDNEGHGRDSFATFQTDEVQTPQRTNPDQFPHQTLDEVVKSGDDNSVPAPGIFAFGDELSSDQAEDVTPACVDFPQPLDKVPRVSSSVEMPNKILSTDCESPRADDTNGGVGESVQSSVPESDQEGGGSEVRMAEVDSPDCCELSIELKNAPQTQIPTPAANYRDKLGARIWWELEYTAKRLEREEEAERQQQTRQRQGDQQIKRGRRETARHSRRTEPTGWSQQDRTVKRIDESSVSDKHARDGQQRPSELTNVALQPAHNPIHSEEKLLPSSWTDEKKSLEVTAMSSHSDDSACSIEKKKSPSKLASPSRSQTRLGSSVVVQEIKQVGSSPLSLKKSRGEGEGGCTSARVSTVEEFQKVEDVLVLCSTPAISPTISISTLSRSHERSSNESYERRQLTRASTSAVRESPKFSVISCRNGLKPTGTKSNSEGEDEDETMAQMMWGSTHTSYERERTSSTHTAVKEDELQATEVTSAVPFSIRGRVPMRSRRSSSRAIISGSDEPSSSSSIEHSPFQAVSDRTEQNCDKELQSRLTLSRYQASTGLQSKPAVPTPPHIATFIAFGEESMPPTSVKSRQNRLNDLRQKKLLKLQQARDSSLQQQKEKQQQRQIHRPLSFANSIYSKKASNRQLIQNALEFTLLAGGSMEKERALALQALAESTGDNFIVLLKSAKELKFRALYENQVDRDCATRIFSVLPTNSARAPPKLGSSEVISQFFKYSSAKKQFLPVPTRSFTVKTDACALVDQLVFKGKAKNNSSALARLL
ncbi:Calmodulin-regulated spectrin-associated protein 2 [Phytophthora pseudosyringae]|uniref:Calmodulin-regulated spectrin-associated protein 2 n=1 Tax=Phytophthora pseudosyringae TaxID=221518 RepID=A0A8T1VTR7_9STRA|nr:Calmodulin-regulated spectrin-associated protein 2 [Phytophthora pseudosyringae]